MSQLSNNTHPGETSRYWYGIIRPLLLPIWLLPTRVGPSAQRCVSDTLLDPPKLRSENPQLIATLAFGELGGVFLAGTVIALLGSLLARNPTHPPLLVLILGAFFVLTVGSLGLRGLTTWIGGNVLQGFHDVFSMLSLGLALALGLLIGHLIALLVPAKKGSFPGEMKA